MAGVLVNQGEERMLTNMCAENMTLRLYTNNYTPVEATTEANVTEAAGNGYASKALTGGSWTVTPGAPSSATYAEQTFTFTGALGNVYGYYITRNTDSKLMVAELFTGGPFNVQNNGDQIKVTPTITLD